MTDALSRFTDGVWLATEPVRIVGTRLAATMTVVELPGSAVMVHSPVRLTPERRTAIEALGTVTDLYAPNTFHQMWLDEWAAAYPEARVHAPGALRGKRGGRRIDRAHDTEPAGELTNVFDEVHIEGFLLQESVLVHRASGTLLVADLVHNIGRPEHGWTKLYSKAMGFHDRVALSRAIRWTAFRDRGRARGSLDRLLELPFDRLVVGHGAPLEHGAHAALAHAYDWLQSRAALVAAPGARTPSAGFCG